jgi:hypothetical protein
MEEERMQIPKAASLAGAVAIFALLLVSHALAGTVSVGNYSLTFPEYPLSGSGLVSCEPWEDPTANSITITGAGVGATVQVTFATAEPFSGTPVYTAPVTYTGTGNPLSVPVPYPLDTEDWPGFDEATNERSIAVAALVLITENGVTSKMNSKQWWVRCTPPPPPPPPPPDEDGGGGCTPGFWKQAHHFNHWVPTGYSPYDDFEFVFGVNASFNPHALINALWLGGGGERALARHGVAGLLNAAHPALEYPLTVAQVIAGVQNAYATGDFETFKNQLDRFNNIGCQLGRKPPSDDHGDDGHVHEGNCDHDHDGNGRHDGRDHRLHRRVWRWNWR